MKKIGSLLICSIFLVLFTACAIGCNDSDETVNTGRYYLVDSQNEYVEIIDQSSLKFCNIDFSEFGAFLETQGINVDVAELNAQMNVTQEYYYEKSWESLMVNTSYEISLAIKYNHSDQLTLMEKTYILQ